MSTSTWIRKGLDIARLPRVRLNNIQDLPGAKKKVNVCLLPVHLAVLNEFSSLQLAVLHLGSSFNIIIMGMSCVVSNYCYNYRQSE